MYRLYFCFWHLHPVARPNIEATYVNLCRTVDGLTASQLQGGQHDHFEERTAEVAQWLNWICRCFHRFAVCWHVIACTVRFCTIVKTAPNLVQAHLSVPYHCCSHDGSCTTLQTFLNETNKSVCRGTWGGILKHWKCFALWWLQLRTCTFFGGFS